jgi:hypothetical protein
MAEDCDRCHATPADRVRAQAILDRLEFADYGDVSRQRLVERAATARFVTDTLGS